MDVWALVTDAMFLVGFAVVARMVWLLIAGLESKMDYVILHMVSKDEFAKLCSEFNYHEHVPGNGRMVRGREHEFINKVA